MISSSLIHMKLECKQGAGVGGRWGDLNNDKFPPNLKCTQPKPYNPRMPTKKNPHIGIWHSKSWKPKIKKLWHPTKRYWYYIQNYSKKDDHGLLTSHAKQITAKYLYSRKKSIDPKSFNLNAFSNKIWTN